MRRTLVLVTLAALAAVRPVSAEENPKGPWETTFTPVGAWTSPVGADSAWFYLHGAGTNDLTFAAAADSLTHPSRLTFLGGESISARLEPQHETSKPFVLGRMRLFNGANTWGTVLYHVDFDLAAADVVTGRLGGAGLAPSRTPVRIEPTPNVEDPILASDHIAVGTLEGPVPIGPYARAFAVTEEDAGEVNVMARLRRIHDGSDAHAAIELLGFAAATDSARLILDREVAIEIVDSAPLPYLEVHVCAPKDIDLTQVNFEQCGLFDAASGESYPFDYWDYRDVGSYVRPHGNHPASIGAPDGQSDLILIFDVPDEQLRPATMALQSGQPVSTVFSAAIWDGSRIRGECRIEADSRAARNKAHQEVASVVAGELSLRATTEAASRGISFAVAGLNAGRAMLSVFDVRGRCMYRSLLLANGGRMIDRWDVAAPAGLYFARVEQAGHSASCKVVRIE